MSWTKLDDGFYDHPKVLVTSNGAIGLYCKALTYCGKHLTDGVLPGSVVTRVLVGTDAEIEELCRNNLWSREAETFRISNYLQYQPSSKSVKKEKKRARDGMRVLRDRRSKSVTRNTGRDGTGREEASSSGVSGESEGRGGRHRLPTDFPQTDALRAIAVTAGCRDPVRMHAAFVDYWHGAGTPKADWVATYRSWARSGHGGPVGKACGCAPPVRIIGKPSVREMARDIAAEWAAEDKR